MSAGDKITPDDLLNAMADADVLDVFCHLPEASRREFEEWVGKARDNENHWRRIDVLVRAMRSAPPLDTEISTDVRSGAQGVSTANGAVYGSPE